MRIILVCLCVLSLTHALPLASLQGRRSFLELGTKAELGACDKPLASPTAPANVKVDADIVELAKKNTHAAGAHRGRCDAGKRLSEADVKKFLTAAWKGFGATDAQVTEFVDRNIKQVKLESTFCPNVLQGVITGDPNNNNPAGGLFQFIPGTFNAWKLSQFPDDRFNPLSNILAAVHAQVNADCIWPAAQGRVLQGTSGWSPGNKSPAKAKPNKCKTFVLDPEIDYPAGAPNQLGPDIGKNHAESAADCQKQCQANAQCRKFTWLSDTKDCYIKSDLFSARKAMKTATSGFCADGGSAGGPCKIEKNKDYAGNDVPGTPQRTKTAEKCCNACKSHKACVGFTWVARDSNCWLKNKMEAAGTDYIGAYSGKVTPKADGAAPAKGKGKKKKKKFM
jgi:hypothetical protein